LADNLPPSCAVVTKSGNLNFLEPSGPVQACNGTALPYIYIYIYIYIWRNKGKYESIMILPRTLVKKKGSSSSIENPFRVSCIWYFVFVFPVSPTVTDSKTAQYSF